MMSYQKYFRIADIRIHIKSDSPFTVSSKYLPFEQAPEPSDVEFQIDTRHQPDLSGFQPIFHSGNITFLRCGNQSAKLKHSADSPALYDWCLLQRSESSFTLFLYRNLTNHLSAFHCLYFVELSSFLIHFQSMLLHSSVICVNGCGIAFTAPSGTGKSTQADLWKKYRRAVIINGDRGIIRRQNGYKIYGSTFAGSSNIYKNESVPLTAIVVLRQASQNHIQKMGKKEAYLNLLSQMSVSSWNKDTVTQQMQWLEQLIEEVPVYLLESLPNQGAVDTLYGALQESLSER